MRLNLLLSTVAAIGIAATSFAQAQSTRDLNGPSRQQTQAQPAQTGEPIDVEIDQAVTGNLIQHVIEKTNTGGQTGTARAIQIEGHTDVGFSCAARHVSATGSNGGRNGRRGHTVRTPRDVLGEKRRR